jgi:hypothetical protein
VRASRTEGITYTNVNRHVTEGRAELPGLRDAALEGWLRSRGMGAFTRGLLGTRLGRTVRERRRERLSGPQRVDGEALSEDGPAADGLVGPPRPWESAESVRGLAGGPALDAGAP